MRKEASRYPFTSYPAGWYRIARATDVRPYRQHEFVACGRRLVISRDGAGRLALHDGQDALPIVERNHLLFGWLDEAGQAPRSIVPHVPEHHSRAWTRPFALRWRIRIHIQEIAENALDLSHFATVHTYLGAPRLDRFELDGPRFAIELAAERHLFGRRVPTQTQITYHGLGVVVAYIQTPVVRLAVLLTTTPVDAEHVELCMEVAIEKSNSRLRDLALRAWMPREISREFERDIPVWEAKIYCERPLICRTEGDILRVRRWAAQFYGASQR